MKRDNWNRNTGFGHATKSKPSLVKMVPLNRLRPGVVVWAHVPFDELDESKTRPAVVSAVRGRDIELLPVTSSESRRRRPEAYVEVESPEASGLGRRCGIRRRPVLVDRIEIIEIIGELDQMTADLLLPAVCANAI